MNGDNINGRRLVCLFLLGLLLFNFPLLSLVNRPALVWGIPVFYLYLFAAWGVIISLTRWISRSRPEAPPKDPRW